MSFPSATQTVRLCAYLELKSHGETLQFPLQRETHHLGRDPDWADLKITEDEEVWNAISRKHAVLRREGQGYRIYDGDGKNPSSNGTFRDRKRIDCNQGYLLDRNIQLEIGQDPKSRVLLNYIDPTSGGGNAIPSKPHLGLKDLKEWPVELGRIDTGRYSSLQLDAPTVSRRHGTIDRDSRGNYILRDLSTNGTFVNGRRIEAPAYLREGDRIQIGPFTLVFQQESLELFDRGDCIRLDAHNLSRQVKTKKGSKLILNDVTLAIEPGQLVALVGGSGAGKSTLMKTLLGVSPLTSGEIYLNGDDLHKNFDVYRSQIGYVPQDDIVHRDLTVEEVLGYACQLRLPPDTNVAETIDRTLSQIQLTHVRSSYVRDLSGGQRKRVSIGVELLADPKLFFLDEPTSGLDPGLDKEMMKLLRDLADRGRTIVLVTHATSNLEVCDRIAFMGQGGHLCYFGPPKAALGFFKMPSLDFKYFADIYIKLSQGETASDIECTVTQWERNFLNSPAHQSFVATPLSPGNDRNGSRKSKSKVTRSPLLPLRQLFLLSKRYFQLFSRDIFSVILAFAAAPIVTVVLSLTLKDRELFPEPYIAPEAADPMQVSEAVQAATASAGISLLVLFVFTCTTVCVGLFGSVQEIVKEANIYIRERLVNLGLIPYLGSKMFVRGGMAILQTLLILAAVLFCFHDPQTPEFMSWSVGVGLTTFLTLLASISLGLTISTFVKNESQSNYILILMLLFQIIFSGAVFLFDPEGFGGRVAWLTIARWSTRALGILMDVNALGEPPPNAPEGAYEVYDATAENLYFSWGMLGVHILVYLALALGMLKSKDVKK